MTKSYPQGQMLIESLLAMGIITVGVVGVVGLASRSIGQTRGVSDQFVAVNLAAEGLEVSKNILDSNVVNGRPWNEGFAPGDYEVDYTSDSLSSLSGSPHALRFDSSSGLYSYSGLGSLTSFKRTITIEQVNQYQIRARSKVDWLSREGNKNRSVVLETDFLNWR